MVANTVEALEGRTLLAGSVAGVYLPASGDTNLTNEGNLGYIHIGYPANPNALHTKAGVVGPALNTINPVGGATFTAATTPGKTFTWTDAGTVPPADQSLPSDPIAGFSGQNRDGGNASGWPAAEDPPKLFDNTTSKYLNQAELNSGADITIARFHESINAIRFYNANDAEGRDPTGFIFFGSNDNGATWTQIATQSLTLSSARNTGGQALNPATQANVLATFTNNQTFGKYRLQFTATKTDTLIQIGEAELLHIASPENATATSDAASVTGDGKGFNFVVPAVGDARKLRVYVGVEGGGAAGGGVFTATLSDRSGTFTPVPLVDDNATGMTTGVYELAFQSGLDNNQQLTINWVAQNGATVTLSGATWIEAAPPVAARNLKVVDTTPTTIRVSWNQRSFTETSERLEIFDNGAWRTVQTNGPIANPKLSQPVQTVNVTGLTPNKQYQFRVMTVNVAGTTETAPLVVTTPAAPQGQLTVVPTLNQTGTVNLSAQASTLDWVHWGEAGANPSGALPARSNVYQQMPNANAGTPFTPSVPFGWGGTPNGPRIGNFTVSSTTGGTAATPTVVSTNNPSRNFAWTSNQLSSTADVTSPGVIANPTAGGSNPAGNIYRENGTDGGFESGGTGSPGNQDAEHAFDNRTDKYLNFQDFESGVLIRNAQSSVVNGIRFYTADDGVERDPANYFIQGSNDWNPQTNSGNWTDLTGSGGDLNLPTGRNPSGQVIDPAKHFYQQVFFPNTTAWQSYRIIFPRLRNANTANSMQIGEIELLYNRGSDATGAQNNTTAPADTAVSIPAGNSFKFSVPAAVGARKIRVYVAADGGGTSILKATLSDGSAAVADQTLLDDNAAGPKTAMYEYTFAAGATGAQTLNFEYIAQSGTAILQAAQWFEFSTAAAPSNVVATPTGQGRVNVAWKDNSGTETGFQIERSTNGGTSWAVAGSVGADVSQFVDSGLANSQAVIYRVSSLAVGGGGLSAASTSINTAAAAATGVNANYYQDVNDPFARNLPQNRKFFRVESRINQDWGNGSPDASVPVEDFSGRWDGTYVADITGPVTFSTDTDDGGRLYIDLNQNGAFDYNPAAANTNRSAANGELVVNEWVDQGKSGIASADVDQVVNLVAGQKYRIRVEMYERGGGAGADAYVQWAGQSRMLIPQQSLLLPAVGAPTGIVPPVVDAPLPVTQTYTPKQHVTIQFNESLRPVTTAQIVVKNQAGAVVATGADLNWVFDYAANQGIITFNNTVSRTDTLPGGGTQTLQGQLPDGNYSVTITGVADEDTSPSGTGNLGNYTGNFYILRGDTQANFTGGNNADRKVDLTDYQRVELNMGKVAADRLNGARDGDFDYDGDVDQADLKWVLSRIGATLAAPATAVAAPVVSPSKPAPAPAPAKPAAAKPVAAAKPAALVAPKSVFSTKKVTDVNTVLA